jgi:hypothetical protein
VSEEHRRTQRRVVLILVIRFRQAEVGFRIDPVLDRGAIDPDQNNLAAALDGDLAGHAERRLSHCRGLRRALRRAVALAFRRLGKDRRAGPC